MFEWLFQTTSGTESSLLEVLQADLEEINLHRFAIEKAISMIGNAIAKSEIMVVNADGRVNDSYAYRLNVEPNDNETGTDFWKHVVMHLVTDGECLVIPVKEKFYIAESWTRSNEVLKPVTYSNIVLSCAGNTLSLRKNYKAGEVIHIRYSNSKLTMYLRSVVNNLNKTASAVNAAVKVGATPKYKLAFRAQGRLVEVNADGTTTTLTKEKYAEKIKNLLTADGISIVTQSDGIDLSPIEMKSAASAGDLEKLAQEIYTTTAMAFDIPGTVFSGNVTEKSDAVNEFITFAVSPYAESINDAFNSAIVGEESWIAGERVNVWLARFKHVDVIDSADKLDKLRGMGFSLDEIFEMIGYPRLNTEFSSARALTKNYGTEPDNSESEKGGTEE